MSGVLARAARDWINAALAFAYPEWCAICDGERATPAQGFVCDRCRATVRLVELPLCESCGRPYQGQISGPFVCTHCLETQPSYTFARSAAVAKGAVLEAIHRYKYNRELYLEPFLAGLLVNAAVGSLTRKNWDALVPVPLHWRKEWQREFNQAARLGKPLAKATGIPLNTKLLQRKAHTRTQTKLTREERFKNVRGAFQMRRGASVRGLRIVVIDDVFTTGATTNACAETLLGAGAASVCVWTVARGT